MFKIKILPVDWGDSILVSFGENSVTNILIDSGTKHSYSKGILKRELEKVGEIHLLILTHLDEDHIGGILKYYQDENRKTGLLKEVIFNCGLNIEKHLNLATNPTKEVNLISLDKKMSLKQGLTLEKNLLNEKILNPNLIYSGSEISIAGAKLSFLSPNVEDLIHFYNHWEIEKNAQTKMSHITDYKYKIEELSERPFIEQGSFQNKASLAFILEYNSKKVLFMGDAFPSIVESGLRLRKFEGKIDLMKISHHGSKFCTSDSIVKMIDCNRYIVSTSGKNGLPNKEALARIITNSKSMVEFNFNYSNEKIKSIFTDDELEKKTFSLKYLDNLEDAYTINLSE